MDDFDISATAMNEAGVLVGRSVKIEFDESG
jgi:hypothetical protein